MFDVPKDPDEMKLARESSWLCNLFQSNNLTITNKQKIIREMVKKHKFERCTKNG